MSVGVTISAPFCRPEKLKWISPLSHISAAAGSEVLVPSTLCSPGLWGSSSEPQTRKHGGSSKSPPTILFCAVIILPNIKLLGLKSKHSHNHENNFDSTTSRDIYELSEQPSGPSRPLAQRTQLFPADLSWYVLFSFLLRQNRTQNSLRRKDFVLAYSFTGGTLWQGGPHRRSVRLG